MTNVEVEYRCAVHPTESAMRALSDVREVYGIRRVSFASASGTLRVEYDATRLTKEIVSRLLRGAGFALAEEVSLIPPQVATEEVTAPAPQKS